MNGSHDHHWLYCYYYLLPVFPCQRPVGLLLPKGGHGIFNVHNDLNAYLCGTRKRCKHWRYESVQVLTKNGPKTHSRLKRMGFFWVFFIGQNKTGPSNVTHRGQIINGFTLQCVGQLATRSTLYTLVSKLKISHRKFGSLSPEETSSDGVALPCMIEGPSLSIESRLFPRKLSIWPTTWYCVDW